jgi:alcohol dehydrogenase
MLTTEAAVLYRTGYGFPFAQNRPLSIEKLELSAPGRGEVLVEIASAGLCHSDLSVIDGTRPRIMPMVLGHEASGIVREVGAGVEDFAPGDHIVFSFVPSCGKCEPCLENRPVLCEPGAKINTSGLLLGGGQRFKNGHSQVLHHHLGVSAFSRYTVVSQQSLVKIDPALPLHLAALFGCAVVTGVGAVLNTAQVRPGSRVAIFGLGGIGLSMIMGARAAAAGTIIAIGRNRHKLERAIQAGATHVIDCNERDPVAAIREITNGGAEYAFESVGSETVLCQAYNATRRGGTTVTVGLPHPQKQFAIPAVSLVAEERTVKGSYMGSAVPRRDIPRYIAMHQAGLLPVELLHTHTIALEDINQGFDDLAQGKTIRQLITFN